MGNFKSINDFKKFKEEKIPVSMITCYEYGFAQIIEQTDIDTILVGDSLGNVIAGYSTTLPVTVDQIIYHTEIVRRGAPSKFIIADLPFMSYHVSVEDTLRNCGRIMKETGANAVKLEGGEDFREVVEALTRASIPVVGHLGLTPQSFHKLGGYSLQGKSDLQKKKLTQDAKILEEAGASAVVLEMVPESLAAEISEKLSIPTIGIGAGRYCNGQVLVINDMLGLNAGFTPKFVKKYADLFNTSKNAIEEYHKEVRQGIFPEDKHIFK